uniref:Ig-like domain-containing protein n=1 Tax=Labrus bergylta TaxID=56723 RepID=A0A3Q3GF00_9LABR
VTTSSKPTVFPLMQCGSETANTVTLGCLATGFSPSSVTYAWSKAGTALTDFIQYPPVEKSGVYTGISQIKVNKEDLDAKQTFKCIWPSFKSTVLPVAPCQFEFETPASEPEHQ